MSANETAAQSGDTSVVASLTEALVNSNDRLLGLIRLTEPANDTLDETTALDEIAIRAVKILDLSYLRLTEAAGQTTPRAPASDHQQRWWRGERTTAKPTTEQPDGTDAEWSAVQPLNGNAELSLSAFRPEPFETGDTKVLTAVFNLMAGAIRSARLHQAALRQAVVAQEHNAAAQITTAALQPGGTLPFSGALDIHALCEPARTTGGDLWAWHRTDDDTVWFAVGDVSGKGLPAAVLMTTVVHALRSAFVQSGLAGPGSGLDPAELLSNVDREVFQAISQAGLFVTLVVGRCDANHGLAIANAGHSPVYLVGDGELELIEATVPPLGVIEGSSAIVWERQLDAQDALILATDGFTEQRNPAGELFGEDTYASALLDAVSHPAASDISEHMVNLLIAHADGREQDDDSTLFVLKHKVIG